MQKEIITRGTVHIAKVVTLGELIKMMKKVMELSKYFVRYDLFTVNQQKPKK